MKSKVAYVKGTHKIQTNQFVFYKVSEEDVISNNEIMIRISNNKPIPYEYIEELIKPCLDIIDSMIISDYTWKIELE